MSVTLVPKPDGYKTSRKRALLDAVDDVLNEDVCPNCFARVRHVDAPDAKIEAIDEARRDHYGLRTSWSAVDGCKECGELDGRRRESLSLSAALDRVPALAARLQEAGHDVDVDAIYNEVRARKTDPEQSGRDHEIAREAAVAGLRAAGVDPRSR